MQSSSQILTTNRLTPSFYRPFLSPNQQCQSTEGKNTRSRTVDKYAYRSIDKDVLLLEVLNIWDINIQRPAYCTYHFSARYQFNDGRRVFWFVLLFLCQWSSIFAGHWQIVQVRLLLLAIRNGWHLSSVCAFIVVTASVHILLKWFCFLLHLMFSVA